MKRITKRFLLSLAALSPGVAAVTIQEMAFSLAMMVLGVTGAFVVVAATAVPTVLEAKSAAKTAATGVYHSLLRDTALSGPGIAMPKPVTLRAHFMKMLHPARPKHPPGFQTQEDHIAALLAQVMARWQALHVAELNSAQLQELWLTERLLRASPTEALSLAQLYIAPEAMLAMRDRVVTAAL